MMKRSSHSLLLFLLSLLLGNCAAATKGKKSGVDIELPPETEIRNFSEYDFSIVDNLMEEGMKLKLRSGRKFLLEFVSDQNRDSVFLYPVLNPWYLVGDVFLLPPVGMAVDLTSKAVYEFSPDVVRFPSASTHPASITPLLNIYDVSETLKDSGYILGDYGLILEGHLGIRSTPVQTVILGNDFGIYAGYRFVPSLVGLLHFGGSSYLDFVPSESDLYTEGRITDFALDGRFYVTKALYGVAGVEYLIASSDTLYSTVETPWRALPDTKISQSIFGLAIGAGFTVQGLFLEYRRDWGLEQLRINDTLSTSIHHGILRFGAHVEF